MKLLDVLFEKNTQELRNQVAKFTSKLLDKYISEVKDQTKCNNVTRASKDIHDAVWGTILLNAGEVLIIDSPLIQRLRNINHLGLAGLLFPGADYSRFEHTLGVLEVATRIGNKIIEDKNYQNINNNTNYTIQILRLSAIFHDVGHLLSSHAAEKFYESPFYSHKDSIEKQTKFIMKYTGAIKVKLSEILSVFAVISPSVIKLIELAWPYTKLESVTNYNKLSGLIASLILGVPTNWDMLPFTNIINGTIDADKCDYLARDSLHTGVPVAVDLSRIIQKMKVIKSPPKDYGKVWDLIINNDEKCCLLGISLSARKAVEEIIISRTLMHEKIYYHHKIVTAEEMLRKALQLLDQSGISLVSQINKALLLNDSDILSGKADLYIPTFINKKNKTSGYDKKKIKRAIYLLNSIFNRKLLKRACAFSSDCLNSIEFLQSIKSIECLQDEDIIDKKVEEFITDIFEVVSIDKQLQFINEIVSATSKISKILHSKKVNKYSPLDDVILLVGIPYVIISDLNIPVEVGDGIKWSREIFQAEIWDNSRKKGTNINYIVAPENIRHEVFLAVEKILYKYGFVLTEYSYLLCKLQIEKLMALRQSLAKLGYYKNATKLLPINLLCRSKIDPEINKIIENCQSYEGPNGAKINEEDIIDFLRQFYYLSNKPETLIENVISLLGKVKILSRMNVVNSFNNIITKICKEERITTAQLHIVPVGNLRDSSTHITYFFNDIGKKINKELKVESINDLLEKNTDKNPVVMFYEDAFWTGKQIITLFQELLNIPAEQRELPNERHGQTLKPELIAKLKKCNCYLCFCYGNKTNKDRIRKKLLSLGIVKVKILCNEYFNPGIFTNSNHLFNSNEYKKELKACFNTLGRQILLSRKKEGNSFKDGWDEKKINKCALGYRNGQQLLIFPWNTPTYTLTALWGEGTLKDGTKWKPLFPRQSK